MVFAKQLGLSSEWHTKYLESLRTILGDVYPEIKSQEIEKIIADEFSKFEMTLDKGLKEFEKLSNIDGESAFQLYQTYGFPWELTYELAQAKGLNPSHELLGLVELTSHGGFTMSPEFLRRYPPNPKFRKGGTTQAIHQMMAYHQTLEEEGVRSRAMLKDIGDALVATDNSGNINFVNDAALTAMGYESMEVMGKSFIKMFRIFNKDGKEVESNENPLRNALFFNKKVKSNECLLLKKSGDQFQVSITATPVIFYQRTIGGIVVIRDITREKDVDRMKTEFISLASHQLRTPLSSIKWLVELLLDDYKGMNEEQIQIVKNVYESNQRMIDLVDGLLNISRIESGRIIIEPKATNLKTLVEKIVGELTPKIIEKELKVNIDIANDVPEISVDPKLISNVYLNFLTNSIKYSINKGQVNVKIYIKDSDVISEVKDSGLGIPKKQQVRVFEKFFRADNVTRVVTDGSGLGLYLTKLIVEASGGKIGFESEELKGSTFWFSVPIAGVLPKKGEVSIE